MASPKLAPAPSMDSRRDYSGLSLKEQQAKFAEATASAFNALRARNMEPNEACALALKVAAGVAELPPTPEDLVRSLAAERDTPLAQRCASVTRFFASADCLAAAFWPAPPQDAAAGAAATAAAASPTAAAAAAAAATTTTATGAGAAAGPPLLAAAPPQCPIDFAAVALLYDRILGGAATAAPTAAAAADVAATLRPTSAAGGRPSTAAAAAAAATATAAAAGGAAPAPAMPSSLFPPTSPSAASPAALAPAPIFSPPAALTLTLPAAAAAAAAAPAPLTSPRTAASTPRSPLAAGPLTAPPPPPRLAAAGPSAALASALAAGVEGLLCSLSRMPYGVAPGLGRALGCLLANPLLDRGEHHDLLGSLVTFVGALSAPQRRSLAELLASYPPDEMRRLVSRLHGFISLTLFRMQSITRGVEDATRLLALVHEANAAAGARAAAAAEAAGVASPSAPSPYGSGGGAGPPFGCGPSGYGNGGGYDGGGGGGWEPLEAAAFYNDAINHEDFNLKEDFRKWKHPHKYDFCFCKFPFMYDPGSKARILQMENQMSQVSELHSALFRGLFGGGPLGGAFLPDMCPFLVLRVRRGPYLVQDTLIQIDRAKETDSLRKPLKVKFIGEEGVDEGGVAKEFFQLLVRALFNPDFGMFTADAASRLHWFRPSRLDMDTEFELVGILIGLAIYNSHILEFQFPSVLYKKLMGATAAGGGGSTAAAATAAAAAGAAATAGAGGAAPAGAGAAAAAVPPPPPAGLGGGLGGGGGGGAAGASSVGQLGLEDLRELAPEVASSLGKLLALPAEQVEHLGLVFQVEQEMGFGEMEAIDLVPGGGEVGVTAANRRAYVELYVRHLLQDSIAQQFGPFRRGFLRLCSGAALGWFSASELELLVCGSRRLAMEELQAATQYDDGYTKDSEPVRWFWEVVLALPPASQKRLLFFVTGSDRVPIKGLAHLNPPFVISRAGAHSDRLPSAHTCFNHLLLPHYNSKDVLKERLELSLQNAEGFGLM